jgi:hypothetical protein
MLLQLLPLVAMQAVMARADFHNAIRPRQAPDACSTWASYISFCKSATPGFVDLPSTDQVPCLCYGDNWSWYPDIFDNAVDACASWAATADVVDFTTVDSWQGICTIVGDIYSAQASTIAAPSTIAAATSTINPLTTPSPAVQTTAAPTAAAGNLGCSFVLSAVSFCTSVSPGFLSMAPSLMAPCLCYSSTSWMPTVFDDAVSTCADFISTADAMDYSSFTSHYLDFCTEVGDVLNTPTQTIVHQTAAAPVPTTVVLSPSTIPTVSSKPSSGLRVLPCQGLGKIWGSCCLIVLVIISSLF